jgi:penicillin amidase
MAWDLKSGWSEIKVNEIIARVGDSLASQIIPSMKWYKSFIYNNLPPVSGLADEMIRTDRFLEAAGLQVFKGSNNWVVSGKKNRFRKPMLANDMHLSFGIPGICTNAANHTGKLNVTGVCYTASR